MPSDDREPWPVDPEIPQHPAGPVRRRLTIGDLMLASAGAALLLGVIRSIASGDVETAAVVIAGLIGLPILFVARDLFDALLGVSCPRCGLPSMAMASAKPFQTRYYRCPRCGARRKRSTIGLWRDADDPADDLAFAPRREAGRYEPEPDLEFEPGPDPLRTTTGRLLTGKLRRKYEAEPDRGDTDEGPPGLD